MTRQLDKTDETIGRNIRAFRTARGATQMQLAAACNVTFQQIQKYERGANAIATTRIPDICRFLRIKPADLFQGLMEGNPEEPLVQLDPAAIAAAMEFQKLPRHQQLAIGSLIRELLGRQAPAVKRKRAKAEPGATIEEQRR